MRLRILFLCITLCLPCYGQKQNRWAVCIGATELENKTTLPGARDDIETFADYLKQDGVSPANIQVLLGSEATVAKIITALQKMQEVVAEDDAFFFLYSGRYGYDDNTGKTYMATCESTQQPNKTDLDWRSVTTILHSFKCRNIFAVVYQNHHPQLLWPNARHQELLQFATQTKHQQIACLLSNHGEEIPQTMDGTTRGVFCYHLLQGLYGRADHFPRDDAITAEELCDYVEVAVARATKFVQHPISAFSNNRTPGSKEFVICQAKKHQLDIYKLSARDFLEGKGSTEVVYEDRPILLAEANPQPEPREEISDSEHRLDKKENDPVEPKRTDPQDEINEPERLTQADPVDREVDSPPTDRETQIPPIKSTDTPKPNLRYRALIIANYRYRDAEGVWGPLNTPRKCAPQLKQILEKKYRFKDVILVENANTRQIQNALSSLYIGAQQSDSLFIFYMGHSYWDRTEQEAYWVPLNADGIDTRKFMSARKIHKFLLRLAKKVRHVFIACDASFSPYLIEHKPRRRALLQRPVWRQMAMAQQGCQILAFGDYEPFDEAPNLTTLAIELLDRNTQKSYAAMEFALDLQELARKKGIDRPHFGMLRKTVGKGEFFFPAVND